jgi:hypothetical protein
MACLICVSYGGREKKGFFLEISLDMIELNCNIVNRYLGSSLCPAAVTL